jgi:isopentenyl diphosphate isomerase/L-lactate dehydrogenase-like FMN-dependent dehydrogenase
MHTTLLGYPVASPIGIAPTARMKMAHDDGEVCRLATLI